MKRAVFHKRLIRTFAQTNSEYKLIQEGDKVVVGLSGGKDSLTLVHLIKRLQMVAPYNFDFLAVTINYGMGENLDFLRSHCEEYEIPFHEERTNIFEVAEDHIRENSSFCSYFSRMRRGALYSVVTRLGYNTLALGHHLDDAVESFFMNLTHNGKLRTMPPIYHATDYPIKIVRPLIKVRERALRSFADTNGFVTIGDEACPAFAKDVKLPIVRAKTKAWLSELEKSDSELFNNLRRSFEKLDASTFFDPKFH